MSTYRTSSLLFQKTLDSYKEHIFQTGVMPLSRYCASHNVYYLGMKRWMSEKKISIMDIRKSHGKDHSLTTSSSSSSIPISSSSIVPICMIDTDREEVLAESPIIETISKLKITYPTGVVIEVEAIPYSSFKDLLSLPTNTTS